MSSIAKNNTNFKVKSSLEMGKPLLNDTLIKSVGCSVNDSHGEYIGIITEITKDASGMNIEYAILKSKVCFGRGERFFAIPASSTLIEITKNGNMLLHISKDDLQFAKGVAADKCPKPNLRHGNGVFELYNYKIPLQKNTPDLSKIKNQEHLRNKRV